MYKITRDGNVELWYEELADALAFLRTTHGKVVSIDTDSRPIQVRYADGVVATVEYSDNGENVKSGKCGLHRS